MFRAPIAHLICLLMVVSPSLASAGARTTKDKQPTFQDRLAHLPAGSVVEVKTTNNRKSTGRLGALSRDSFEIDVANGQGIEKRSIRYDEVKSLRTIDPKGIGKGLKIALWTAAGFGIAVGVVAIASATGALSN